MSDDSKAPRPIAAAKPESTILKQMKSRWGEVHDPNDELVCLMVYRKRAREGVRRHAV